VTVVLTAGAAAAAWSAHRDVEDRILQRRVQEAGAVLTAALPSTTSPLVGAVELAEVTDGGEASFDRVLGPLVGDQGPFVSASIWPIGGDRPQVVLGERPRLADEEDAVVRQFIQGSIGTDGVSVIGLLDGPRPVLGYSLTSPERTPRFAVYAERALPEDRTAVPQEDSAFRDLDYAIYLGDEAAPDDLLAASRSIPLPSPTAETAVSFGDQSLLLVMHPTGTLSGELSRRLPVLVALVGGILAITFTWLTDRLVRRRVRAEVLAEENGRLYAEQRSLAYAVQHSLLPADLPHRPDVEIGVQYVPGVDGIEVGGDWYDVVALDDDRLLLVVGDVAGRGLRAATVMALLRHATRAHLAEGVAPAELLPKLTRLLGLEGESAFATVLCIEVDLARRVLRLVNAGHPRALLLDDGGARFLDVPIGPPVGIPAAGPYPSIEVPLPEGGTLLAFTDGLFERRGESVDVGMERLRRSAEMSRPLPELLVELVQDLTGGGGGDDIAVVGLRWPAEQSTGRTVTASAGRAAHRR